jgi:hypothetical protein
MQNNRPLRKCKKIVASFPQFRNSAVRREAVRKKSRIEPDCCQILRTENALDPKLRFALHAPQLAAA